MKILWGSWMILIIYLEYSDEEESNEEDQSDESEGTDDNYSESNDSENDTKRIREKWENLSYWSNFWNKIITIDNW